MQKRLTPLLYLCLFLLTTRAYAQDISQALSNFSEVRSAQIADDRCHILSTDERHTIDDFAAGERNYIARRDSQSAEKFDQIEKEAASKDQKASCKDIKPLVKNTYQERLENNLAVAAMPYVWAMDLGDRCKTITPVESATINNAYIVYDKKIFADYGRNIFMKSLGFVSAAEGRASQFPCSDSRKLIDALMHTLKPA